MSIVLLLLAVLTYFEPYEKLASMQSAQCTCCFISHYNKSRSAEGLPPMVFICAAVELSMCAIVLFIILVVIVDKNSFSGVLISRILDSFSVQIAR
jgi:hypothetical protein